MNITKQKETHRHREENQLVISTEERERWRKKIGKGDKEVQITMYKKISYKDILYSTGNIVNIS